MCTCVSVCVCLSCLVFPPFFWVEGIVKEMVVIRKERQAFKSVSVLTLLCYSNV